MIVSADSVFEVRGWRLVAHDWGAVCTGLDPCDLIQVANLLAGLSEEHGLTVRRVLSDVQTLTIWWADDGEETEIDWRVATRRPRRWQFWRRTEPACGSLTDG